MAINIFEGFHMYPAGYFLADHGHELAYCRDCYNANFESVNFADVPVGLGLPTDEPVHCAVCAALLVTTLTLEGVKYVLSELDFRTYSDYIADVYVSWRKGFADQLPTCALCSNLACGSQSATGNAWLCAWCIEHEWCTDSAGFVFYNTQMTGELRAKCEACGLVLAYWDCVCELADHACTPVTEGVQA